MAEAEIIQVGIFKPRYPIGQVIYIPKNKGFTDTKISGYDVQVIQEESGLVGVVSNYHISQMVFVRRGEEADLVYRVKEGDFYVDKNKATNASKFLAVRVDDETWKLAIGDRKITDEKSPYFTENSGLPPCCANISEARDILLYCKRNDGLIVHDRDKLSGLIREHGLKYKKKEPIGVIFRQLEIK